MSQKFNRLAYENACRDAFHETYRIIEAAKKEAWKKYKDTIDKAFIDFYGPDPSDATKKYDS